MFQFVIADILGRAISVCPGTIKTFNSYEEARAARNYGGSNAKFVGKIITDGNRVINKTIWWEDGTKNWHEAQNGESIGECLRKKNK